MNNKQLPNIKPLKLSEKVNIWPPVVLAPMAGITHYPFRKLCRNFGSCLTVSEMVIARPLVENNIKTLKIAQFGIDENPRSIQLYGIDPYYVGEAVKRLVAEGQVDHIDLNFGCPVKKVTRRGGGAALPYKINILQQIVKQAVSNAETIPVTLKCRMGITADILTYIDTGFIAQEEGCKAIALHARTAAQLYTGDADWQAIKKLKQTLNYIYVLGNGDIFSAQDAIHMIKETHCDGVVIGRGCLGKPWLFRDIEDLFSSRELRSSPNLSQVIEIMLKHLDYMIDWFGEQPALMKFRRDASFYLKSFLSGNKVKNIVMNSNSRQELLQVLERENFVHSRETSILNLEDFHKKTLINKEVTLPYGFLDSKYSLESIDQSAEIDVSGG